MSLIIGLTGGIGSGKTSATNIFSAEGITVIDADKIAHELTKSQGIAIPHIKKEFGQDFISKDGSLYREKMRNLIFSNAYSRKKLEDILHPLIQIEIKHCIETASSPYTIVSIPLLLETASYSEEINRILVIDCDEKYQISRTILRDGLNEQEVRSIIAAQESRQLRINRADDVIVNNADICTLENKIKIQHNKYLSLLNKYAEV
ncbi:MAG: dephospho-CoA kinase [Nitrosomonadaceae bacterium]|nr:dephospho-CoA kinase [Nitrosomonadaceae bacterium]|tara:strand:- start:49 stop:663 length:615 start_codon:yes stop_codon:yes gene_type:complete